MSNPREVSVPEGWRVNPDYPGILVPANRWQLLKMLFTPESWWGNILVRRKFAQLLRHNPDRQRTKHLRGKARRGQRKEGRRKRAQRALAENSGGRAGSDS
jgi:hypothetical protein